VTVLPFRSSNPEHRVMHRVFLQSGNCTGRSIIDWKRRSFLLYTPSRRCPQSKSRRIALSLSPPYNPYHDLDPGDRRPRGENSPTPSPMTEIGSQIRFLRELLALRHNSYPSPPLTPEMHQRCNYKVIKLVKSYRYQVPIPHPTMTSKANTANPLFSFQ
jgi:hypothetical protein